MPKGRKPNDGRGRLGGRAKGTPNKEKPIKAMFREHSMQYFTPSIEEVDKDGNKTGRIISQYEADLMAMKPADRVSAELQLLKYHTPQMQATNVDMTVESANKGIADKLSRLADGEDIPSEAD